QTPYRKRALEKLERQRPVGLKGHYLLLEPPARRQIAAARRTRPFLRRRDDLRLFHAGIVAIERVERREDGPDFFGRSVNANRVFQHGHECLLVGPLFLPERAPGSCRDGTPAIDASDARTSASRPSRSARRRRTNCRSAAVFASYFALQAMIS